MFASANAECQLRDLEAWPAKVASGSASYSHAVELTAVLLTAKLSGQVADVRRRHWPAMT